MTKKKRKSPIRHRVRNHTRQQRPVRSYIRGKGLRQWVVKAQKKKIEKPVTYKIWEELTKPPPIPWVRATMGTRGHIEHEFLARQTKGKVLTKKLQDNLLVIDLELKIRPDLMQYVKTDQLAALADKKMNLWKTDIVKQTQLKNWTYAYAPANSGLFSQIKIKDGYILRLLYRPYRTKVDVNNKQLRNEFRQKYSGKKYILTEEAKRKTRERKKYLKSLRQLRDEAEKINKIVYRRLHDAYDFESGTWIIKRKKKELDTSPIKLPSNVTVRMSGAGYVDLTRNSVTATIYSTGGPSLGENRQYLPNIRQAVRKMLGLR